MRLGIQMRVWRYFSIALVIAGVLCLGLVQFGSRILPAVAEANQKTSKRANEQSDEFYFGASNTEIGRRVWFLKLDLANRRGKLFMRPGVLELTNVKRSETGHITFRTETDIGDVIYQFEGDQGPVGITGRFDFIRAEPDTVEEVFTKAPVVLEKITLPVPNPRSRDVSGVYSNLRYNERSGDLSGAELILFWRGNEPRGIFLNYEDMEPLALSDVSLSGASLKFRVVTLGGEQNYEGTFSGKGISLRQTDPTASPYLSTMVLPKKGEVRSVFDK